MAEIWKSKPFFNPGGHRDDAHVCRHALLAVMTRARIGISNGPGGELLKAANVFSVVQSLLWLFARKRMQRTSRSESGSEMVVTSVHQGNPVMSDGFDMRIEIGKLSRRILEPVAAKVPAQEVENAVARIRQAFEELNAKRAPADTDFKMNAINILEPIQTSLTEVDLARIVDRLRGAMAEFCQSERDRGAG